MVRVPFPCPCSRDPRGFADRDLHRAPPTKIGIDRDGIRDRRQKLRDAEPKPQCFRAAPPKSWRANDIRRCVSDRLDQSELFAGAAWVDRWGLQAGVVEQVFVAGDDQPGPSRSPDNRLFRDDRAPPEQAPAGRAAVGGTPKPPGIIDLARWA